MANISGSNALKPDQLFTLADWRAWPEDERWELIHGVAYNMSPSPRRQHQKAAGQLFSQLERFLDGKPCQPFIAPFDVFLPDASDEDTVVEPDVLVVCDPDKVQDDGVHGAPDFVAEILSDSTAYKDLGVKKQLYEASGVREYWIIHPLTRVVSVFILQNGQFTPAQEYLADQEVTSTALPGFAWRCP